METGLRDNVDLNGWVSARIVDGSRVDLLDRHGCVLSDNCSKVSNRPCQRRRLPIQEVQSQRVTGETVSIETGCRLFSERRVRRYCAVMFEVRELELTLI